MSGPETKFCMQVMSRERRSRPCREKKSDLAENKEFGNTLQMIAAHTWQIIDMARERDTSHSVSKEKISAKLMLSMGSEPHYVISLDQKH